MKEHAVKPESLKPAVKLPVAVFVVTEYRMTPVGKVHANLMRTPGMRICLHQGHVPEILPDFKIGNRRFPVDLVNTNHPFTAHQHVLGKRSSYRGYSFAEHAANQGKILLLHVLFPELFMQLTQHAAFLGHNQTAAGFPVQTVGKLQKMKFRSYGTQSLDYPVGNPASAVNGHEARLVDHHETVIFIKNGILQGTDPVKIG